MFYTFTHHYLLLHVRFVTIYNHGDEEAELASDPLSIGTQQNLLPNKGEVFNKGEVLMLECYLQREDNFSCES